MRLDYLELEDLLIAAELFLGHAPEVRDYGLLESALARPRAVVFGQDAYPTLDDKAAALLLSLVQNHALVDGNKRLGWFGVVTFYELNRRTVRIVETPHSRRSWPSRAANSPTSRPSPASCVDGQRRSVATAQASDLRRVP